VVILARNGKELGTMQYGGDFSAGMHRYYSGLPKSIQLYGYQIGEKASKIAEDEHIYIRAGIKIYGPIHPAFRAGFFIDKH
jgi:hypothetical protein